MNSSHSMSGSTSDGSSMDISNHGEITPPINGTAISSPAIQGAIFGKIPLLRLVGQIGAKYLVAEGPDGLYLIDQHAAHERVLFEKLMSQYKINNIPSQKLLEPATVTVAASAARVIEDQISIMKDFGFEVEPFGPNAFQIRALPALFAKMNPSDALLSLVDDFEDGRVCKRMAVKTGQILSPEEQRSLLNDLESCVSPRTCPHGRPTMIHLSVDLLDKQFGRKGAL